jgi:hypothetical protein
MSLKTIGFIVVVALLGSQGVTACGLPDYSTTMYWAQNPVYCAFDADWHEFRAGWNEWRDWIHYAGGGSFYCYRVTDTNLKKWLLRKICGRTAAQEAVLTCDTGRSPWLGGF